MTYMSQHGRAGRRELSYAERSGTEFTAADSFPKCTGSHQHRAVTANCRHGKTLAAWHGNHCILLRQGFHEPPSRRLQFTPLSCLRSCLAGRGISLVSGMATLRTDQLADALQAMGVPRGS